MEKHGSGPWSRGEGVIPQGQAAPGLMGEAPFQGSEKPSVGKGARIYCDVHRTRKNGEGFRITFTADGVTFRHVDSFLEIPANAGDRVFVDVLPLQHTDGVIELLRRGVEVYYLRRTTLIAKRREELKLSKSARSDIKALMAVEERWFRMVSEDFVVMRRMIAAYRSLMKSHQQLLNKSKALSQREGDALKPAMKAIEEQMRELAVEISEEAGRRYQAYRRVVEELGIDHSFSAMEALAELMTYIDFKSPLRGLKKLLGLYKPIKSKKKKHWRLYNGQLRQAVNRLATACYRTIPNGRQCWLVVRHIKELSTPQTQG